MTVASLPSLLQRFFTERLITQQGVSSHTVAGYREYLPAAVSVHDHTAPSRAIRAAGGGSGRAISRTLPRAFGTRSTQSSAHAQSPSRRPPWLLPVCRTRRTGLEPAVSADSRDSLEAVRTRAGGIPHRRKRSPRWSPRQTRRRGSDNAIARCSSWRRRRGYGTVRSPTMRRQDVELGVGAHVRCMGKGRKSRCTPLRPDVIAC